MTRTIGRPPAALTMPATGLRDVEDGIGLDAGQARVAAGAVDDLRRRLRQGDATRLLVVRTHLWAVAAQPPSHATADRLDEIARLAREWANHMRREVDEREGVES